MRLRALTHLMVPASAVLISACEGPQPLEPSATDVSVASTRSVPQQTGPYGATASSSSETRIDVSWQDNSTKPTSFEVHRSINGESGAFALLATTAARITSYSDQAVGFGAPYCYKVRGVQTSGSKTTNSAFSNTACAATVPSAPTNVAAVAAPATYVNISWEDNSSIETGYQVLREVWSGRQFFLHATTPANAVAHADDAVRDGTQYCYQVRAVRKLDHPDGSVTYSYSAPSSTACATAPLPLPPVAPSNTIARPSSSTTATVAWTDNSPRADGFRNYRSTDEGTVWILAGTVTRMQWQGFEDTGRQTEQRVCYRVTAFNAGGESPPSNASCITPPAFPTNVTATRLDAQTIEFKWNDNSSIEEGYQIWMTWGYGVCDGASAGWYEGEDLVVELPPGSTSYRHTEVSVGCGYENQGVNGYYIVSTKDGGRSSAMGVPIP